MKHKQKYRDPFKGMIFKGNPVSKKEYIEAYQSYVNRCSGVTSQQSEKN